MIALEREEVAAVWRAWPDATVTTTWEADGSHVQNVAVSNVLNNLLGYPHGEWEALEAELGVGETKVASLLERWREVANDG